MIRPTNQFLLAGFAVIWSLQRISFAADELMLDGSQPCCGKVCKLVCDTKKLTAVGYGSECKDICLPDPSRQGCKHCATCYGKCEGNPCDGCPACAPKCTFCWRDWFACGCAQPRTVHVLTKYQAEKKICWYHWEVVDAACCDGVTNNGPNAPASKDSTALARRTIYKSAPENAQLGDVLPISEEEWVKLAAILEPDPTDVATTDVAGSSANRNVEMPGAIKPLGAETKPPTFAERLQRMFKK